MFAAAAVILAAGQGSRLGGTAKATLRFIDGRTFLETIGAVARAAGCAQVLVVAGGAHLEETMQEARRVGCDVVINTSPEEGMCSSLVAGLTAVDPAMEGALCWPVDHAFVTEPTVRAIVSVSRRDRIVIPCWDGRGGHPTSFGAEVWPELSRADILHAGARRVVHRDPTRILRLPVWDSGAVADVDSPGDLDRLQSARRSAAGD